MHINQLKLYYNAIASWFNSINLSFEFDHHDYPRNPSHNPLTHVNQLINPVVRLAAAILANQQPDTLFPHTHTSAHMHFYISRLHKLSSASAPANFPAFRAFKWSHYCSSSFWRWLCDDIIWLNNHSFHTHTYTHAVCVTYLESPCEKFADVICMHMRAYMCVPLMYSESYCLNFSTCSHRIFIAYIYKRVYSSMCIYLCICIYLHILS